MRLLKLHNSGRNRPNHRNIGRLAGFNVQAAPTGIATSCGLLGVQRSSSPNTDLPSLALACLSPA